MNDKSVDGVLGSQTQGGRMEGADGSTELWRHPLLEMLHATKVAFSQCGQIGLF